ncbi:hypothetical protein ACP70R_005827 [Stipagrostis hirtigluma subsp. patula]
MAAAMSLSSLAMALLALSASLAAVDGSNKQNYRRSSNPNNHFSVQGGVTINPTFNLGSNHQAPPPPMEFTNTQLASYDSTPSVQATSTNITGAHFTFHGFRSALSKAAPAPQNFTVIKASMAEFPALKEHSVSYALLSYPPGSVNPMHTHPRASELLLVVDGALSVGFVDTANKVYTQDLAAGDMFVFPKGTVHWQYNKGSMPAKALSAFGSAAAGLVSLPVTVFGTGIDDTVLAKSFKADVATVQKLKADLTPPKKRPEKSH